MAYLAINGYALPPCKRGVTPTVTTLVDSGRNANGTVVGQRIGRDQYKIDNLEWSWLTAEQWSKILSILDNFFVNVTFIDPVSLSLIHISEPTRLRRISYAVFCLKKKKQRTSHTVNRR